MPWKTFTHCLHYIDFQQARAKEKERELHKMFMEKQRHLQETQMTVATKLGEAEERATSLHAGE